MGERSNGEGLYMPLELIRECLLRCDVKTVLVSKSVSKDFKGVISSPDFVQEHYKHSRKRLLVYLSLSTLYTVFARREARLALYQNEEFSFCRSPSQLQFQLELYDKKWKIFKVVNGVFCIFHTEMASVEQIVLVNPATRQLKVIPRFISSLNRSEYCVYHKLAAFGLTPVTGHLKLVMFEYFKKWSDWTPHTRLKCRVYVCSTEDYLWIPVSAEEDAVLSNGYEIGYIKSDAYLNGVYYWIYISADSDVVQVAAFDMGTHELSIINVGDCYKAVNKVVSLSGEDDALRLFRVDKEEETIEIWTMTDEHNWIRGETLGPIKRIKDIPLVWSENKLLIRIRTIDENASNQVNAFQRVLPPKTVQTWLYKYNSSSLHLIKLIEAHEGCVGLRDEHIWEDQTRFYIYRESLVPLPGAEMWQWDPSSSRCIELFSGTRGIP